MNKVHVVAPTLNAVRSIGGFRTSPDYSFRLKSHKRLSALFFCRVKLLSDSNILVLLAIFVRLYFVYS